MPTVSTTRYARILPALLLAIAVGSASAQTKITPPPNKYPPSEDVKVGLQAAAQVQKEMPLLNDASIDEYIAGIGQRLVAAIPPEQQHPEFHYTFRVVNQKEINAFALPGGPMFLNRGMIEAAKTEGEVAGVMAHEMSHVTLRHGTAQATKGEKFQIGAIAGQVLGAIVGGPAGSIIAQGSNFGLSTYFMKFSREYETQADVNGAQLMARAGYDPKHMSDMFRTLEAQVGSNGPEWLSDHPNPGNRSEYIAQEARMLQIAPRGNSDRDFQEIKTAFAGQPKPQSMAEIEKRNAKNGGNGAGGGTDRNGVAAAGTPGQPVPAPSGRMRTERGGSIFQVQVPDNWRTLSSNSFIRYVPENGYGPMNGQNVMTHGVQLGVTKGSAGDLQASTDAFVQALAQGENTIERAGDPRVVTLSGRQAIVTPLNNRSPLGGDERIAVYTAQLADGNLFYALTVVPGKDESAYSSTFNQILRSIRLSDRGSS